MKLELVSKKDVTHVELTKDEKYSLGITFRDGTKDEEGPVVKKIKFKSSAGTSFAVAQGDVVLSLNGCATSGLKSRDIHRIVKAAGPTVDLELQYETQEMRISPSGVYRKKRLTTRLKKVNGSFGFVLRKKDSFAVEYPVVSNIKQGSPVYRNGQIQEGDHLVQVGNVSLSWLSLEDIASILQQTDKAELTFEYKIRVVNFSETERKMDLEVDISVADMGMNVCMDSEVSDLMCVSSIRLGSIAERCGLFSVGDVILYINESDTKFLTPSKANLLLQNSRKCRRISFIPKSRKEIEELNVTDVNETGSFKEKDTTSTTCSSRGRTTDWKHVNTPVSSNIAFSDKQRSYSKQFCDGEQRKAINKFQSIAQVMQSLKQNLSQLSCEAFENTQNLLHENCVSCSKSEHTVTLCASCLTEMNTKCAQAMDFLCSIIAHFVTFSTNPAHLHFPAEPEMVKNGTDENRPIKVSTEKVFHLLMEVLPNVFSEEPELQKPFKDLAKKVIDADTSCNTCGFEVNCVMITVQKLLLLLSLRDKSVEIKDLISQLVDCLLETKFSCDLEPECQRSSFNDVCNDFEAVSPSCSLLSLKDDGDSLENISNLDQNTQIKSNEIKNSTESRLNIPQLQIHMDSDYLRIAVIENSTESEISCNENNHCEANTDTKSVDENDCQSLEVNMLESSSTSLNPKDSSCNNNKSIYKSLKLTPAKIWRSLDSILRPRKSPQLRTVAQNELSPNPQRSEVSNSRSAAQEAPSTSFGNAQRRLSPNHKSVKNRQNISESNGGSTRSSFRFPPQDESDNESRKTRTHRIEVKMVNDGKGFGLGLCMKFNTVNSTVAPVIHAIKPKSPSYKAGIMKSGDRIVAINHQSTLNITPKELQSLKKSSFSTDNITLTIEFDVMETDPKFGTFDVVLDKTLKTGLVFEEMRTGFPMVVSGIVKGSAAHRCGQLFPGDKIMFFRCVRNEEFDPVSYNYNREESVLITVQRDPSEGIQDKSSNASPCYSNPCFSHTDSVPRRGMTFIVKKSVIHAVEGTDALVLDQEVTLFRDPVFWDFGFLIGENPVTGRAYVTDIRPDGPASDTGVIEKFDRIVEVNGVSVDKNAENSVLSLLSQASHKVDLLIRRLYHEESKAINRRH